jgi:hypothetical protein
VAIDEVFLSKAFADYRSGIISFRMQQQLPSSSIPRRPRGAIEPALDNAFGIA